MRKTMVIDLSRTPGELIKARREELSMTQQEMTDAFNRVAPHDKYMKRVDISKYESGTNEVPASKLLLILRITGREANGK